MISTFRLRVALLALAFTVILFPHTAKADPQSQSQIQARAAVLIA